MRKHEILLLNNILPVQVGPNGAQVAVVQFNQVPYAEFQLQEYQTKLQLQSTKSNTIATIIAIIALL